LVSRPDFDPHHIFNMHAATTMSTASPRRSFLKAFSGLLAAYLAGPTFTAMAFEAELGTAPALKL
jgi:hypothetical protein